MNYPMIIKSTPLVLVEFYAEWCPHCRRMEKVQKELTEELGDETNFFTIDVDRHPDVADEAGVKGWPTFIIYRRGREVYRAVGEQEKTCILDKLEEFRPKQ